MSGKNQSKIRARLWVDSPLAADARVELNPADSHYVSNVMRLRAGDALALFNGRDGEWLGKISSAGKRAVSLTLGEQLRVQRPEPDLWLAFAPVKRARIDFIAQKATELGVSRLLPVMTQYTNVTRVNTQRLQANAKEAAEQCERLVIPEVSETQTLAEMIAGWPAGRRLMFCDETLAGGPALEVLQQAAEEGSDAPWAVLTGPEGGFSAQEHELLRAQDYTLAVTLGPRLLRADTAALAALTLWQAAMGDWR
jgi:16S rRNA (uracil1498-N3)-methyltransferase